MQVSVENTGNLERRVTFSLPADKVETAVGGRLREIARTARIRGFRPGKVPTSVIEQRYGKDVRNEILGDMLRQAMDQAVRDNDLRIAGNPSIREDGDASTGEALAYVAEVELVPDFGDLDMGKLKVVRHTSEVTDEDIDRMIENLRIQRQSWSPVERAAKSGDLANIQTVTEIDGQRMPQEGAEKASTVIGSGAMLADMEKAIEGMSPGESKDLEITLPADWHVPQFAGKALAAHIELIDLAEPVLPEVDGTFIRSFGVKAGDMETFRKEIRANLERELKGALMNRLRREVGEQLVEAYKDVELPPRLVEAEAQALAAQATENARRQGVAGRAADPSQFSEAASKRVRAALLVGEIARLNELRLEPARLNETMRLIASTYEQPEQVIELYRNDPQLLQGLQSRVMEEQVIDWIAERAEHTEQALSFQEAISG